jgi:hypothetical protein
MEPLSLKEAYVAMFSFLEVYNRRGPSEVVHLLSSMALLPDGEPFDPGMWQDWVEAVERVKRNEVDPYSNLKR